MIQGKYGISFTKALLSFQLDAMVRARNAYQNWHAAVHGDVTQPLPLRQENIKAFCADLAKAGYAPNTIIQLYLAGLCTWVSCFPFLDFSKKRYFTLLVSPSIYMSTKYIKNYNSIVQWNTYCIIWNSFKHKLIVATQINNNIYFHLANNLPSPRRGPVPAGCRTLDRHLRDWHAPTATAFIATAFIS